MFEKVADSYDKMNDAMSFGIHRVWKNIFIQRLNPPHGTDLLDVAGGSGMWVKSLDKIIPTLIPRLI